MAIKGYCGLKSCCDCSTGCDLDDSIPCSPDCENLTQDGNILIGNCLKAQCEEVKYIFGMPACSDGELMQSYGPIAKYPYN